MNFLNNLDIGKKLGLGFAAVTTLMLLLAGFSFVRMTGISDAVEDQRKVQVRKLDELYVAREALAQTGLAARNAFIFQDDASARKELAILDAQREIYLRALTKMAPEFVNDADFERVKNGLLAMAEELKRPKKYRDDNDMEAFGSFLVDECSPLRRRIVADIDLVLKKVQAESDTATAAANATLRESKRFVLILSGVALLISALIALLITRGLVKQLGGEPRYAAEIAGKIASGDLATNIITKSQDTSSLLFAIKTMRDNLASIVREVRIGTDTIAASSSDIAQGNSDLSVRTEQQAYALEKTNVEMTKLTSAIKQNAENAHQANELATSASAIAEQSGKVVDKVIRTMEAIDDSSRKIVEIISVIDSIAFQTNILALNAAVEAARAGEQGRGFAVVASEVRNLAQRSATAAKEIKSLIDDSVDRIKSGTVLVGEAGSTMLQVVESVRSVSSVMQEISLAGLDQSKGINAVGDAVAQMDQTTQQNASLVEQASAAAESLRDQAANLSSLVKTFVLAEHATVSLQADNAEIRIKPFLLT